MQISVSTVGRALSNDPRISLATRKRVADVASELGYVANRAAQMMRGASSQLVGLLIPDIRNGFYSTAAHALSKCLEAGGYQLMLCETDDDRVVECRHLRELSSASASGVIVVPSAKPMAESVRLLASMRSIQLLRKNASLGEQSFAIDDSRAIHLATQHLLGLGHERIGYIGGSPNLSTGAARLQGFRDALRGTKAARLACEEVGPPSSSEVGRSALRRLLALPAPPTAIVLGSVQITYGVLEEAHESAIAVPRDLSIVGFSDELSFRWWGPGLTTLALPVSELATACGLWFLHQLKTKNPVYAPYSSISAAQLVIRGSTRAMEEVDRSRTSVQRASGGPAARRARKLSP
ncbi:transcriptional regulator, LacI family [Variovorax sp. PDC80]|nr:transcriptional regulator, LacI family [Variovorax sp. PDC80]